MENLMNKKKFYEEPFVEIIEFNLVNVITESSPEDEKYEYEEEKTGNLPFINQQ